MRKFLIIALLGLAQISCARIDSSEVGIKFKKYGVTQQGNLSATDVSGLVFYNPLTTDMYTYSATIQDVDYAPFPITAKGGGVFSIDMFMSYQLLREKAIDVFSEYRKPLRAIEEGAMATLVFNQYKDVFGTYTAEEIMDNKPKIESEVEQLIRAELMEVGFVIKAFRSEVIPPVSLSNMIDAKNAAVQAALRAENEVKTAEATAKINIAKAEGEASALKIKADAEAYYNRTVANSLTPSLVQKIAIDRWNGALSTYSGAGAVPFLNLK